MQPWRLFSIFDDTIIHNLIISSIKWGWLIFMIIYLKDSLKLYCQAAYQLLRNKVGVNHRTKTLFVERTTMRFRPAAFV